MSKHILLTFLATAILTLFSSCGKSSTGVEDYTLDAQMDTSRFSANATTGTLTITTNGSWNIKGTDGATWFSFSPSEGTGNSTVTITISKNETDEERFAQIIIYSGDNTKHIYFSQAPKSYSTYTTSGNYFELPKDTTIANCLKITRFLPGNRSSMRNFTMLYDTNMKYAYWVAYPLTSAYIGSSGRSEAWDYDPLITDNYQPVLFSAFTGGYSRGHQIPSADRTYTTLENSTTFIFTNMTAQNYNLNGGIWLDFENKVRTWMKSCDTMYVVTGAMITTKTDKNITYAYDNSGAKVAVPKYYYKALAEKRGNNYYTIAFKIDNADPGTSAVYTSYKLSVSDLEKITGFTYFPALSETTKSQIDSSIFN